jgi:membrane protein YqaA with SNARE-associated domain
MSGLAKKIYSWAFIRANTRFAPLWLGLIFLLELVSFVPMDAVLFFFCLENPFRRYQYAFMATVGSVVCGGLGYVIGFFVWEAVSPYVLDHLFSTCFFNRLAFHYQNHQHSAVFMGALLPIPFKALSLSAGACSLNFLSFIQMVVLGRVIRFFFIALVIQRWGVAIKIFIDRHFQYFVFALVIKIVLVVSFFWLLGSS